MSEFYFLEEQNIFRNNQKLKENHFTVTDFAKFRGKSGLTSFFKAAK
jgi:hypothetical protein